MIGKIASWVVWTAFTVVFAVFIYRHTGLIKPATAEAKSIAKEMLVKTGVVSGQSSRDKLIGAREAFARGQVDQAISQYNDYIANHSKDADARGELGNVYYVSGRVIEAADTYYDAAKLLMEKHELDRVDSLLPVIAEAKPRLARELAQEVRKELTTGPTPVSAITDRAPQSSLTRY
jgi:hypothetical protein